MLPKMLLMKSAVFERILNFQQLIYEALVLIGSTPEYIPFYGFRLTFYDLKLSAVEITRMGSRLSGNQPR